MQITGRLVDILQQNIYPATVTVEDGMIQSVTPLPAEGSPSPSEPAFPTAEGGPFILPGFIDAHVHIESSLLIPSEFARLAVTHGTVATVSDPHEIANVCGLPGVEFMIRNGQSVPFHFNFGAPSCVPATTFETAGATLDAAAVTTLLQKPEIKYLSEMMNFPGVLHKDPEVMEKIAAAQRLGKPIDGHAPGLRGQQAKEYIQAGISTDHECFTAEEALDKLQLGMKILIREGSAARNFEALIGLLNDWSDQIMFCSDDKHPDSLVAGHIDRLCARAVAKGINVFKVLKAACINPIGHYKLESGQLRPGDSADFIVVEDLQHFKVLQTYIRGQLVAQTGTSHIASTTLTTSPSPTTGSSQLIASPINQFNCNPRTVADFAYLLNKWGEEENVEQVYVIEALDGQLITNRLVVPVADTLPSGGQLNSNPEKDILKIVVVNRYLPDAPVAKSFIKNFGLKRGALASSVAHDSHNIVAVGVDDESICRAVNLVIAQQGGLACVDPAKPTIPAEPSHLADASEIGRSLERPLRAPATSPARAAAAAPPFTPISDITGEPLVNAPVPPDHSAPASDIDRALARPLLPGSPEINPVSATPSTPGTPAAGTELILPLPVAGLMSMDDGYRVAESYTAIDHLAKGLGSTLAAPFMTLSFMALLVIPHLKLSDLGLFDGDAFKLL
jgi:adenine deaminase